MARQLEGIKKFNDGVAEQEKLQDKLFLENMAAVAGTMAATHAWRQMITITRTADVLAMTALPMGALAGYGGPSTVTVHGTDTPNSAAAGVFRPGMNGTSYAGCAAASPVNCGRAFSFASHLRQS